MPSRAQKWWSLLTSYDFQQCTFRSGEKILNYGASLLKISVQEPNPHGTALILVCRIWIRSKRAKMTHKNRKKLRNFMFQVLDVLF
jgi:hypothetical protein